jgi:transcriptional regulator with XRE-family HTH domain
MEEHKTSFARILRDARKESGRTLRELSEVTGKAISYLSDVEQGRKGPPDLETVRIMQEFLKVRDDRLVIWASRERRKIEPRIISFIQRKPALEEVLMRAEEMDLADSQLREIFSQWEISKRNE